MINGLQVWVDEEDRAPAEQMAADEALVRRGGAPVVRFYSWTAPAVTFGYSQRYSEVRRIAPGLPSIRRWTGGGIVFHGEDLTIAVAIPEPHEFCRLETSKLYRHIHEVILQSVASAMPGSRLAEPDDCRPGPACFESPAPGDILNGKRKICGGALRRGKCGVLYQGSLHGTAEPLALGEALAGGSGSVFHPDPEFLEQVEFLDRATYATAKWNEKR